MACFVYFDGKLVVFIPCASFRNHLFANVGGRLPAKEGRKEEGGRVRGEGGRRREGEGEEGEERRKSGRER